MGTLGNKEPNVAEFDERMELMRRVRLFKSFSDEELSQINDLLRERRYRKNSIIFEQGDPGDALYIVESGRVKATIKDEENRERIIALFGEGDYFGEMALITDQPRSATMAVVGDANLLILPKEAFERFLATNTQVMAHLLREMTQRVVDASARPGDDEEAQTVPTGKVIVVFSPKGGTGKTTLAVNLAIMLRTEGNRSVALLDSSFPFGDIGVMMNMEPRRTMSDVLPHINELDGEILSTILQPHASGVKVLLAPATPEESELITGEHVAMVLTTLREQYEYIIVDTHGAFTEVSLAAMDAADLVMVVTTLELAALKNVRQFIDTVTTKLGYPPEKLALIVNRVSEVGGLTVSDIEASVGQPVAASIVSQGQIAVTAANRGAPFAMAEKNTQIYKDILNFAKMVAPRAITENDWAEEIADEEEAVAPKEKFKVMVRRVQASALAGMRDFKAPEILSGIGLLLIASGPPLLIVAVLSWVARFLNVQIPTIGLLNIAIWAGIVVGTFLLVRMRPGVRGIWAQHAALGGAFGLVIILPAISAVNAANWNVGLLSVFFAVLFYTLLGLIGTLVSQRARRGPRSLFGS